MINRPGGPSFLEKPAIKQADGGKKVLFECKIAAEPAPTCLWYKDDILLSDAGKNILYQVNTSLFQVQVILKHMYWIFLLVGRFKIIVKEEAKGQYYCALELSNPQPTDAATYKLNAKTAGGDLNANLKLNIDGKSV